MSKAIVINVLLYVAGIPGTLYPELVDGNVVYTTAEAPVDPGLLDDFPAVTLTGEINGHRLSPATEFKFRSQAWCPPALYLCVHDMATATTDELALIHAPSLATAA